MEDIQLTIEKLVEGGDGLARCDGKAVFVAGALPGETVLACIEENKTDFSRAVVSRIITASPDRVEPPCPYYGVCGGCDLQHLDPQVQPRLKASICKENLKRMGGIDIDNPAMGVGQLPVVASDPWGYRSRVRFHVDLGSAQVGFLSRKSDSLVDIRHCPILCDSLNRLLDEKRPLLLKAAKMHKATEGWQVAKRYVEVPAFAGDTAVSLSGREVCATVAGHRFMVDSNVFFQSNRLVLPAMVECVKNHVTGDRIMDLYSGVGTFAAFLEGEGRSVVAVERDKRCLELAKMNLVDTEFFAQNAEHWVRTQKDCRVSTVVVDPPRTGLDVSVVRAIGIWRPQTVVYVSCDSVTLARDVKRFAREGYALKTFQVFDLYPQTSHVESISVLVNSSHKGI
ncbi:MAG: class I SAM-dependent RNA methyltransferase [Sphaerochaetaceae bacterium]